MSKRYDYDPLSGQIFTESSARVAKHRNSDWIGEYKTPSLVRRGAYHHDHGARPLLDVAKAHLARNMRSITPDHLRNVPWVVAEKLWEEIVAIRGESFHAWRVMASSYGDNFNTSKHRYYIEMRRPPLPFMDYFKGITSPSLDWLTCLRISPKYVDKADLVKVANMKNLAVLDLSDNLATVDLSPSQFDERIMKTWSEISLQDGAFKQLRALLFGWQPSISTWIFKYLNSFPALRLLVLTACPNFGQWNRKDWETLAMNTNWEARHAKKSVQLMRPLINDDSFYFGAVSSILYDADILGSKTTKPVLECWLGGPPAWENVLRDFPKVTQTVWLEKVQTTAGAPQLAKTMNQSKRLRDAQAVTKDARSPPPKRSNTRMRPNPSTTTAAELLADLTKGV